MIRWGTWLKAAEYHAENYFQIKSIVETLKDEDSEAIRMANKLFMKETLCNDLAFIKSNFSIIHTSITTLETKGLTLQSSLKVVRMLKHP